jgi:DNA-binding response OmpR family regulator
MDAEMPGSGYGADVRILLVEDSPRVADAVGAALRARALTVVVAESVRAANEAFEAQHFDVAVVDIGLPDGSGLEWCRATRDAGSALPILVLTARAGVADRVAGLEAGADDYLGKPFSMDELVARVRALSRRGPRWNESVRAYGHLVVDRDKRTVSVEGASVPLTPREHDIVALLAWRDGRVVSRDEVLEAVWGDATPRAGASLEVLVARIRRKLSDRGVRDAVRTVRQVGYAWGLERSKRA